MTIIIIIDIADHLIRRHENLEKLIRLFDSIPFQKTLRWSLETNSQ